MIPYRKIHLDVPVDCARVIEVPRAECAVVVVPYEHRVMGLNCEGLLSDGFFTAGTQAEAGAVGFATSAVVGDFEINDTFYTSLLYPVEVVESMAVGMPADIRGNLWGFPDDELNVAFPTFGVGTLVDSIRYVSYNNAAPDELDVGMLTVGGGTLVEVIRYVTYNNAIPDELDVGMLAITGGTLIHVIEYITYSNYPADELNVGMPTFGTGTLA